MLNIGSLALGIGAWLFAGMAIATPKAAVSHKNTLLSFSLCTISLLLQLCEINRRVLLADYAAIEDTIRAVVIAAAVLVAVTILLNLIALLKSKNR